MNNKTIATRLMSATTIDKKEKPGLHATMYNLVMAALEEKDREFEKKSRTRANKVVKFFKVFLNEIGYYEFDMGYDDTDELCGEIKDIITGEGKKK